MKAARYQEGLINAHMLAALVRAADIDFGAMLEAIQYADTLGPIVDPTAWMKGEKAMCEDKRVLEILGRARRELDALHRRSGRSHSTGEVR